MDGLRGSSSRPGPARLGSRRLTPASSCLPAALARLSPLREAPRALRPLWRRPRSVRGTLACCVRALRRLASCCPRRRCIAAARTGATAGLAGTPALLLLPVCGPGWRSLGLCSAMSSLLARCVMRLLGSLLLLGYMMLRSVGCPRACRTGARLPAPPTALRSRMGPSLRMAPCTLLAAMSHRAVTRLVPRLVMRGVLRQAPGTLRRTTRRAPLCSRPRLVPRRRTPRRAKSTTCCSTGSSCAPQGNSIKPTSCACTLRVLV